MMKAEGKVAFRCKRDGSCSFGGNIVSGVARAKYPSDAVNLKLLKETAMVPEWAYLSLDSEFIG